MQRWEATCLSEEDADLGVRSSLSSITTGFIV